MGLKWERKREPAKSLKPLQYIYFAGPWKIYCKTSALRRRGREATKKNLWHFLIRINVYANAFDFLLNFIRSLYIVYCINFYYIACEPNVCVEYPWFTWWMGKFAYSIADLYATSNCVLVGYFFWNHSNSNSSNKNFTVKSAWLVQGWTKITYSIYIFRLCYSIRFKMNWNWINRHEENDVRSMHNKTNSNINEMEQ